MNQKIRKRKSAHNRNKGKALENDKACAEKEKKYVRENDPDYCRAVKCK